MQNLIKALELTTDYNLADFSLFLWQNRIAHRINEEAGKQILWVTNEADVKKVLDAFELLNSGKMVLERVENPAAATAIQPGLPWKILLRRLPVTLSMIVLSMLGAMLVSFDAYGHLWSWLTFEPFTVVNGSPRIGSAQQAFQAGQYWRLITPIFLHFGLLHVVFNSLWTWELGKRIEIAKGSFNLLGVILLIAIGSNIGQFLWQSQQHQIANFGGMSGVVYGLLGYIWVVGKFYRHPLFMLPPGMMIFMLGWLVFCMSGVFEIFAGNTGVANAAHVCGLLMGLFLGFAHSLLQGRSNKAE